MEDLVLKAKKYAVDCHNKTNQLYDEYPYSYHLEMVYEAALKFIYLVPIEQRDIVLAGCYIHDVIEDTRQTYNDVLRATTIEVAEIAYALTDEKGKNRSERKNEKFYSELKKNELFVFVKLCDRIANILYSKENSGRMIEVYRKEYNELKEKIYIEKYKPIFEYIEEMIE